MDELIEEAMREGAFDDLPGRGRPLRLDRNPFVGDSGLAFQLLKDNDYTLPWIAERNRVLERIEALREEIGRQWAQFQAAYRRAAGDALRLELSVGWERAKGAWQEEIAEINRAAGDANLRQPDAGLEIVKLALAAELGRAGAAERLEE
jgi:DnaJ family protein C protein 28